MLSTEASAAVPAALVVSTVQAALVVAAGQLTAVSTPAALLMKGVLKVMFLQKLKVIIAAVLVAVALGAGGLAYQAAEPTGPGLAAAKSAKPASELEALRKENELLRLNLLVLLEKIRAQEDKLASKAALEDRALQDRRDAELETLKLKEWIGKREDLKRYEEAIKEYRKAASMALDVELPRKEQAKAPDPVQEAEAALKALREARDPEAKRRAAEALEKAVKKLRGQNDTDQSTNDVRPKQN
jgi:hypothetical protein